MARRTRKQKLKSQIRPATLNHSSRKTIEKENYFRRDLIKSLLVIGFILILELGLWLLQR